MTAIAINLGTSDHAQSQDVLEFQGWLREVLFPASSISLGTAARDLFDDVVAASRKAAEPNWDGENARPVLGSTTRYAIEFASLLPRDVQRPAVSADNDGDLSFEWDFGPHRVFSVSVRYDGVLRYAGIFGHNKSNGSEVLINKLPVPIFANICRVALGD